MRTLALATVLILISTVLVAASALTPDLTAKLQTSSPNEFLRIMITMKDQADVNHLRDLTTGLNRRAARELVVPYLKDMAQTTQHDVRAFLEAQAAAGKVRNLQSVFIVNLLHGLATPEVIRQLDNFPGVAEVSYDPEQYMLFTERPEHPNVTKGGALDEVAWGVADVGAPEVWTWGYTGVGVIVGMIDTGCNYNHADLATHMWDGGAQYPRHGYDFYNNDDNPMDDGTASQGGHGTHTSGSVGSDGTAGSQCGVAPDATIMALKVLSGNGYGSEGPVLSGINFAVNHGADIFSMSLGWQSTSQRAQFRTACNNALAAGVIGAIAAGNEGNQLSFYPIPGNCRTPGDVPPPWLSPAQTLAGGLSCVVTIGATDASHNLAYFSSHGPSTWEGVSPWNDYAYASGSQMGLIDPDVSGPGVNVKSCWFLNNNGYADGWSGTSMATPHVAGAMALMLDKNPNLTPAQLDQYLETTAIDGGTPGKDNLFGAGRILAPAAVSMVPGGAPLNLTIDLVPTGSTALPATGGILSFTITLHSNETGTTYFQGWLDWINPSGQSSGTLFLKNVSLPAGATLTRTMNQSVPGSAPNGSYTYWGHLGQMPGGTVYVQDSFPFTKGLDGATGGEFVSQTMTTGWDEPVVSTSIPEAYDLGQNYPNPFNPTTTIPFSLAAYGYVTLKIYNLSGQEVANVLEGDLSAGQYHVTFDGSHLASGIYLYRLQTPDYSRTMKLTLVK